MRAPDADERCDVLHVAWSGRIGGIERLVQGIVLTAATGEGLRHRACLLNGEGTVGEMLEREGLAVRLGLRRGWEPLGLWRLARTLRRLRPCIVHLHTHALGSHVVTILVLPRATRVYSEHSPRALTSDRKLRLLYALLRRTTARFLAATPGTARAFELRGVDSSRTRVVPNGIPVARRQAAPMRPEGRRVGVVARLEPQKRVDLFVDVIAELRRRGVSCEGLIVGDGSLRETLAVRRDALDLGDAIEFAGEQDDTAPWLDRLDVFLMTSELEPFGMAALEAMARGIPVVAMPCPGGLAELVERGGLLLRDRAVTTAADAVERLLLDPAERLRQRAAADQLLDEYRFERVVEQLDAIYAEARVS